MTRQYTTVISNQSCTIYMIFYSFDKRNCYSNINASNLHNGYRDRRLKEKIIIIHVIFNTIKHTKNHVGRSFIVLIYLPFVAKSLLKGPYSYIWVHNLRNIIFLYFIVPLLIQYSGNINLIFETFGWAQLTERN